MNECSEGNPNCVVNKDLYQKIRKKEYNIVAGLKFINNDIDLTNFENPYWYHITNFYSLSSWAEGTTIELEGSELNSQSLFSFNTPSIQSQFAIKRESTYPKYDAFAAFIISFQSSDMYIYKRTYKTFNSALATSFALFKLFNQIISIALSPIYTYYMNTIIINTNFDYELSTVNKQATTTIEHVSAREDISSRLVSVECKKLTTFSALKNVSLFRYLLCRRRNRTKAFYDKAKCVIYKHLSVETLFSYLVEYFKLKKYLLVKDSGIGICLDADRKKLILDNEEKVKKDNLILDELINNNLLYNNYR
jgi:hypothetical protein